MKCRIKRHFIRVYTVCQSTRLRVSGIQRVNMAYSRLKCMLHDVYHMISIVTVESDTAWKTVQILIRWLCQKPTDLDIRCFHKRIYPGSAEEKHWRDKGSCKMSDYYLYI